MSSSSPRKDYNYLYTMYNNIIAVIKAIEVKINDTGKKIDSENKQFAITKRNFNIDDISEKINLLYRFVLEKHNLKILEYSNYIDSLENLEARLRCSLLLLDSKKENNEINIYKFKNKLVELIQEQAINQIDRDIQLNRQKKITYMQCNNYLEFLRSNDISEYELYKNIYTDSEKFNILDDQRNYFYETKKLLLDMFKNIEYEFNDNLFKEEFIKMDIIKLVELLYPDFKDNLLPKNNKKI